MREREAEALVLNARASSGRNERIGAARRWRVILHAISVHHGQWEIGRASVETTPVPGTIRSRLRPLTKTGDGFFFPTFNLSTGEG